MKSFFVTGFILFLLSLTVNGQNEIMGKSAIPPSPEAVAFAKYGEIPVSYYTGIPEIGVPIFKITDGNLELPISLSYHSGGHKVEEIASWVGLGWTLNAGGMVTRVVRGYPDEINSNWSTYVNKPATAVLDGAGSNTLTNMEKYLYLSSNVNGCIDLEPDIYYYNFNGYTGKFFFDWEKKLIVSSNKKIKVRPIVGAQIINDYNYQVVDAWLITDEFGNNYKFSVIEETVQVSAIDSWSPTCNTLNTRFRSSWYISSINDMNNENEILFNYDDYMLDYGFKASERMEYPITMSSICGSNSYHQSSFLLRYFSKRLKKISTKNNNIIVDFEPVASLRTDIANNTSLQNAKALGTIVIKNMSSDETKRIVFTYNYSTGRLTLISVQEQKSNSPNLIPPHLFEYSGGIPEINSSSQDHWGFYNAASNNTLIPFRDLSPSDPQAECKKQFEEAAGTTTYGANREPNFSGSSGGILTKITYPTGGKTDFEYELNDYSFQASSDIEQSNIYQKQINNSAASHSGQNTYQTGINTTSVVFSLSEDKCVKFFTQGDAGSSAVTNGTKPRVRLLDGSGVILYEKAYNSDGSGNNYSEEIFFRNLPPGTYTLWAKAPYYDPASGENPYASIQADFYTSTNNKILKMSAGGVRIKSIKNYPSVISSGFEIKRFFYSLESNQQKSSGTISYYPSLYFQNISRYVPFTAGSSISELVCERLARIANNRFTIGNTQGSHIGYREVRVEKGSSNHENGYTVYKYTSPFEYPDGITDAPPYPPVSESQEYKTGLLTARTDYVYSGNAFKPVNKNLYEYTFKQFSVLAKKVGFMGGVIQGENHLHKYLHGDYLSTVGFSQILKETQIIYDQADVNRFTSVITEFTYDSDIQNVKKRTATGSDGKTLATEFFYPHDYTNPSQSITFMKDKNCVGLPIEIVSGTIQSNLFKITSAQYNQHDYTNNLLRLKKQFKLPVITPLSSSGFNYSINSANGAKDSRYDVKEEVSIDLYDSKGNVLQVTDRAGIITSYIWGYKLQYPVAKIINKAYSDAVTQSGIVLATIDNPMTTESAMRTELNKLRTLTGAYVTTYTYRPLIGMTSETDANNRTVYYEYDAFNRLSIVRDKDNNIIKKICYNYAGQPDVCSDMPSWQITGNTRCKPCPANSSYSTNILQNESKDMNPNSPTYNQVQWIDAGTNNNCGTAVWQNQGLPFCETSNGQNTGNQLQLQKDLNPCSGTYNQYQTILLGYNPTICPLPSSCNTSNCNGEGYKCVYGACEFGYRINTDSYYDIESGMIICVYHYEWSDGTWSNNFYEYNFGYCPLW
jgi:YD repeat-containing protein